MSWNREDAEDATQEILARIATRLSQGTVRRCILRSDEVVRLICVVCGESTVTFV
jgi:hypothetical protein